MLNQEKAQSASFQDGLYDYGVDDDNLFQEFEPRLNAKPTVETTKTADLGIDEEIQVKKKRTPIAKLDETKLLSPAGIPKLRYIARHRLKFRGKGHEFSDVSQLLNAYQLWLDDLYPRAKFTDALGMIEKLGHSKRMQVMRREWINAGKQQHDSSENGPANGEATSSRPKTGVSILGSGIHTLQKGSLSTPVEMPISTDPELSNVQSLETAPQPEQDELDALLAESFSLPSGIPTTASKQPDLGPHQPEHEMDDFEDEMAALAEMEDY